MRVVVVGAGGFVGGWVAERLSEQRDVELVACVRQWASAVRLARRGIGIGQLDLEAGGTAAREIFSGADVVVNAAMLVPSREPDLVAALYDACAAAKVRKIVHFSSAAVYGNTVGVVDEAIAPAPNDDYARGKALSEGQLLRAAGGGGPQVIILRPSIIYGPFSDAWTVRYAQRITRGRWRNLGSLGEGYCNLIHAGDVAKAALAAIFADTGDRTTICNINAPETVTWNNYIERFGDALGVPDRLTPNTVMFRTAAVAAEAMRAGARLQFVRALYRRSIGSARKAMTTAQSLTKLYPSYSELKLMRRKVHYSSSLAEQKLGFVCSIQLKEGLQQTAKWCEIHGII